MEFDYNCVWCIGVKFKILKYYLYFLNFLLFLFLWICCYNVKNFWIFYLFNENFELILKLYCFNKGV